jgi:GNAT superfamily N-acetyltransferase
MVSPIPEDYTPTPLPIPSKMWTRKVDNSTFLVSTNRIYLNPAFINNALASTDMPWAQSMTPSALYLMLNNSLTLGLYTTSPSSDPRVHSEMLQIGMARLMTDYSTMAYLTDVYIAPEHRGKGLAKWLTTCVREVMDVLEKGAAGAFRRTLLFTGNKGALVPFYRSVLGAEVHDQEGGVIMMSTQPPGHHGGAAKEEEKDIKKGEK